MLTTWTITDDILWQPWMKWIKSRTIITLTGQTVANMGKHAAPAKETIKYY